MFRVVVTDGRSPRDGRFIEEIGTYAPTQKQGVNFEIQLDRADYWIGVGAQPSETVSGMIKKDLGNRGPGTFTVPGLMKVKKKVVKKRPARKNVWLPLMGEFRDIPAKPARKAVKVTPLKALKDMV